MTRQNRRKQKRGYDPSIGTGEMRRPSAGDRERQRSREFEERRELVVVRCDGKRVVAVLTPRAVEDYYPLVERFDLGQERAGAWHGRALRDGAVFIAGDGFGGGGMPARALRHVRDGMEGILVGCPVHGEHVLDPRALQAKVDRAEQQGRATRDVTVSDLTESH